jgi:Flp pilus assembly protein TadD
MIPRAIPLLAALTLATAPAWAAPTKMPAPTKAPAPAKTAPKPTPPVTVESLLTQAHAAVTKGDTELALRLAQSAIVADPARPSSYAALGDIYAEAGQADYARNFYDAALGIDPAEPSALKGLSALDHGRPGATANAAR